MKTKVSDLIVRFFELKGVKHAFGIIGSANAHIFDSVFYNSDIELICNHHEQACTMAVQTYWKITGFPRLPSSPQVQDQVMRLRVCFLRGRIPFHVL